MAGLRVSQFTQNPETMSQNLSWAIALMISLHVLKFKATAAVGLPGDVYLA